MLPGRAKALTDEAGFKDGPQAGRAGSGVCSAKVGRLADLCQPPQLMKKEEIPGEFVEETIIDLAAMERLAKVLVFIYGKDHPTTVVLHLAAETGKE